MQGNRPYEELGMGCSRQREQYRRGSEAGRSLACLWKSKRASVFEAEYARRILLEMRAEWQLRAVLGRASCSW